MPDDEDDIQRSGREPTTIRDPVIGTEVSGYRVTGRLGSGGMGVVYEGEQPLIGKRVAIKVLRHEIAEDPEVVQRLVAEARAVNQVGHRGIIDVFGVGHLPDGRRCIVMELLDGEPLERVLEAYQRQHRPMPLLDALVILEEIFSALAAAHTAGVIHRDLKPSNIFLCKQRDGTQFVKLLDFGIAKLGVLGPTPSTRASMMVGTPGFMAPEQAQGGTVGPAMDLYAAGVVAFELLTGRQPFESANVMELLLKHQSSRPPRIAQFNPTLPADLDALIDKLLSKSPADRPPSAEAVRAELLRIHAELRGETRHQTLVVERELTPAPVEQPLVVPGPSRTPQLIFGLAVLSLVIGLVLAFMPDTKPPQPTAVVVTPPPKRVEEPPSPPPAKVEAPPPAPTPVVAVEPVKPVKALPKPVKTAAVTGLPTEIARRIERIERNLSKAEAAGDDMSSIRRELTVVRERLKNASAADAERLQFRLIDLESETAP